MQNPFPGLASQAQSFIFGAGTDTPTYESLKRKREQINALAEAASQGGMPRNGWEGATQTAQILASKFGDRRLAPKEDAERERAIGELTSLMGGGFTGQGFSGTPGSMPTVSSRSAPTGGGADAIREGLIQRGLPEHVADGFLMNFQDESGLDPGINEAAPTVPGSRGGFGLAQWTGPRRNALESYASQTGAPVSDPNVQLDFLMQELQGPESKAAQSIMSAPDSGTAAAAIARDFLRPAPEHLNRRVSEYTGQPVTMTSRGGGQAPDMGKIAQIAELLSNPYLPEGQRMVAGAFIQNELGKLAGPEQMTPYQQAQIGLQRDKLDFDRQNMGGADSPTYGLTPIYGTDADGNTVILQASNQGGVRAVELPEGVTPAPGFDKIDTGTQTILKDRKTGETIEVVETDNAGKARDTAIGGKVGEAQGDAIVQFGKVEQQGQAAIDLMESIITDPALPSITGMAQGRIPPLTQGGTDLNVKIDQLKGKTFLEAFESLKGGGVITEVEGEKATQAIARLDRAQSDTAYVEALRELQGIIRQGVERMKSKVGQAGGGSAMPSAGVTEDGYRFKGGDPADPANWEKVQ